MTNSRDNDNEAKASIAPLVIGAVIIIAIGIIFGIKNYQNHSVNTTRSQISTETSKDSNLFTNDGKTSGGSGGGSGSNGGSHTKPNNGIIPGIEGLSDTSDFEDPYN